MQRLALCAAFVVPFALSAKDPLPPPEIPMPLGVNIHFTRAPASEIDLLAATGFRIVRMDFGWGGIERTVGTYDFSAYDQLVGDMEKRGIRLLFILDYGHPAITKGNGPATDAERAAFVAFARAGARHFKGKRIMWEIWNEPNLAHFWRPAPNVEDYAKLAVATARAIKEEDPEALVLAPATSRIDLEFLEGCFRGGLLDVIDVVTVHPYRSTNPETAESEVNQLRTLMARYSPRLLPIANGEWGFSAVNVPLETQADYLARQALFDLSMGFAFNIWYDWRDDGPDPKEPEHHFGSVARDLSPKPASVAMKTLAETLGGFAFVKQLSPKESDTVVLLFARGKEERVAAWSTRGERTISLPVQRATIVSRDGKKSEVESCKQLTVKSSPIYVIPKERSETLGFERVITPCESWVTARAGEPFKAAFRLENPFERPLRLGVRTGEKDAKTQEVDLAAGETKKMELPFTLNDRSTQVRQLRVQARSEDGKQAAAVAAHVIIRNAMRVRILPPERDALPVEISILDRSPFNGTVASGSGSIERLPPTDGSVFVNRARPYRSRVALPEGHDITVLRVPWPRNDKKDGTDIIAGVRSVEVLDDHATVVLALSIAFVRAFWVTTERDTPVAELRLVLDEGDRNVPLTATLTGCAGREGNAGARLRYEFGDGWRFISVATEDLAEIEGKPIRLCVWIHGDGSGDYLRCRFVDATGQTFQPDGGMVDFKGWKLVEFPLRGSFGFWGGAKDGVIHYPIKWNAVLLIDSATRKAHKGEINIGDAWLVYDVPAEPPDESQPEPPPEPSDE